MTENIKKNETKTDDNPFCHAGMTCAPGCGCASADGICHCPMIFDRKCACDGFCGTPKH